MTKLFLEIINMSIASSITACAVILLRLILKRIPKIYSYALWAIVLFRLICPFSFESSWGIIPQSHIGDSYALVEVDNQVPFDTSNGGLEIITVNFDQAEVTDNSATSSRPDIWILFGKYIWIFGILVILGYSIFNYLHLKYKLSTATLTDDNIYESDYIPSPFVMGFIKPRIYLPYNVPADQLEYILAHEYTHIKRRDYIVKAIAFLALTLHWFNPLIWVCYILMTKDMEMSCDESVLKHSGEDIRVQYSSSLLSMSMRQNRLMLPLAFGESNTKTRIRNVLHYKKPTLWISIIAVILVVGITTIFTVNRAQLPSSENEPAAENTENTIEQPTIISDTAISDIATDNQTVTPTDNSKPNKPIDMTVTREGTDETLSAYFAVSELGYAMYILEDFVLTPTENGDLIHPSEDSSMTQSIFMRITRSDAGASNDTINDDVANDSLQTVSYHIANGVNSFDVTLSYPLEASEGGAVLLHTMLNTFTWLVNTNSEDNTSSADFFNSSEGAALQAIAYSAAKALLQADSNSLAKHMINPAEASRAMQGITTDEFSRLECMFLLWSPDCIKSENEVHTSYTYAIQGEDSLSYVSMDLLKVNDFWRVRWIGIEK